MQGSQIHAQIKNLFLSKFNYLIEEGKVYVLSKFSVVPVCGSYRTCMHPFKINFNFSTVLRVVEDDVSIPYYGFQFVRYRDITCGLRDDSYLVG